MYNYKLIFTSLEGAQNLENEHSKPALSPKVERLRFGSVEFPGSKV